MPLRNNASATNGGDLVHLLKIKENLERLGIEVVATSDDNFDTDGFDLVHLSNLTLADDIYRKCQQVKKGKTLIIVSTIYWNKDLYLLNNSNRKIKIAKKILGKSLLRLIMANRWLYSNTWRKQRRVLKMADLIIVSSREELRLLQNDFKIKIKNCQIIPPGVDVESIKNANGGGFIKKYGIKDFILCIGRIEDLKNQLALIKICGQKQLSLVLIGDANITQTEYFDLCQQAANQYDNIFFLPFMPQTELFSAYAAAKLLVAPSWFESFGLASWEAAASGVNVVSTSNCPLREYLGDSISYCDPVDANSIEIAINKGLSNKPNRGRVDQVLEKYNWQNVSKKTLLAYNELLKNR